MGDELVERCRRGGADAREAFSGLVERHQAAVSRFVARYVGRDGADEIVQETFLRAYQQIRRFEPGTNFAAWLFTIARFLCMARVKEAQRHPRVPLAETAAPAGDAPDVERLRAAMAKLPPILREVVAMRAIDGLDYREIADITGEKEATLRSRLHDALEKLKTILGHEP